MAQSLKRIAVTGGAGHIAYSLLFRIANGDIFGPDQPVALHILEIPQAIKALEGVQMELEDCAYPLLKEIRVGSDPIEIFGDVDWALLIGAKPRGPGMERSDLLQENAKIFVEQGKALNASGKASTKVLVVGNPCNTNCLITMTQAPRIPRKNFYAMTRLDHNRAVAQLALKSGADVTSIEKMTIWGNHSTTQVPDYFHATIKGRPATEVIPDKTWFEEEFIPRVQKRGAEIIAARGASSAASAANAVIDAVRSIETPTPKGEWYSSALCSDRNPYGIEENLIFSFPCRTESSGEVTIISDLDWNESLEKKIQLTEQELKEEREMVLSVMAV